MTAIRKSYVMLCALAVLALLSFVTVAQDKTPSAATPSAKSLDVIGQHRGFTNDKLFLKLDNGKEMTFLVVIPGDKDWKWHKDFETLSRITVTYQQGPGDALPVATAIGKAVK